MAIAVDGGALQAGGLAQQYVYFTVTPSAESAVQLSVMLLNQTTQGIDVFVTPGAVPSGGAYKLHVHGNTPLTWTNLTIPDAQPDVEYFVAVWSGVAFGFNIAAVTVN